MQMQGDGNMNEIFRRWIKEVVETMNGEFTSGQILDKIIYKKGNTSSIGTASAIGWLLNRLPNVEKVKNGVYRRKQE